MCWKSATDWRGRRKGGVNEAMGALRLRMVACLMAGGAAYFSVLVLAGLTSQWSAVVSWTAVFIIPASTAIATYMFILWLLSAPRPPSDPRGFEVVPIDREKQRERRP